MNLTNSLFETAISPKESLEVLIDKLSSLKYGYTECSEVKDILSRLTTEKIINNHLLIEKSLFTKDFFEDEFLQVVDFRLSKSVGIDAGYASFKAGTIVPHDYLFINQKGFIKASISALETDIELPYLANEAGVISLLSPSEMLETKQLIPHLKGNLLVDGIKLGYFLYHAANQPQIESITVVEEDICLIHYFKQFILPQFRELGVKIKIIQDKFQTFITKTSSNQSGFDFVISLNHEKGGYQLDKFLLLHQQVISQDFNSNVYFFGQDAIYGTIQYFTFFIAILMKHKKSKDEVLLLGKNRMDTFSFVLYERICDLVFSVNPNKIQTIEDINILTSSTTNIKILFS